MRGWLCAAATLSLYTAIAGDVALILEQDVFAVGSKGGKLHRGLVRERGVAFDKCVLVEVCEHIATCLAGLLEKKDCL